MLHYESIFKANDGKKKISKEKQKSSLRPKRKRKRINASKFFIPVERLYVSDSILNH